MGVLSSSTSGNEVTGTVNFNVRNAVQLAWLSTLGTIYSKFRVLEACFAWEPIVGTSTNGEICMALLYDQADPPAATLTISRLMQTQGSSWSPIWKPTTTVTADVNQMSLKWYLSGTSGGVAAGNMQTPFTLAFAAQSSLTSTFLGRVMAWYTVEFIEPIDPSLNA